MAVEAGMLGEGIQFLMAAGDMLFPVAAVAGIRFHTVEGIPSHTEAVLMPFLAHAAGIRAVSKADIMWASDMTILRVAMQVLMIDLCTKDLTGKDMAMDFSTAIVMDMAITDGGRKTPGTVAAGGQIA